MVLISPASLTQINSVPQRSKPVVVMLVFVLEVKPADSNAPALLSMKSIGEVQLPVCKVELAGVAVKVPLSAFSVTTEF